MTQRSLQNDPASRDYQPGAAPLASADLAAPPPPAGPVLLEVAWEVCNQVGGIYQVLRSKAPLMVQRWGDRYILVGPYEPRSAAVEFEEIRPGGWIAKAINALREQGLVVHYGRWLVPGRPKVMLIEHWQGPEHLADCKYRLWREHGIGTPEQDWLIDGVVSFADATRRLFGALAEARSAYPRAASGGAPFVGHFHEWMGGLAIADLRRMALPVATVFTTHATLLGRYIASSRDDFYEQLPWLDQETEAQRFNIVPQHQIERACAHGAHVFTTVSSITAEECTHLLGRPVDVVLPNGLTIGLYNAGHEQQRLHGEYKEQIHKFTMGHFFPSYSFDLDRTLYFFTSGRFEPRNKGFDLCLEAMARLNAELKASNLGKNVVLFIISRRPTRSINALAMEKRGVLNELAEVCEKITDGVRQRLFARAASGGKLYLEDLVDEYWMLRYRAPSTPSSSTACPWSSPTSSKTTPTTPFFSGAATQPHQPRARPRQGCLLPRLHHAHQPPVGHRDDQFVRVPPGALPQRLRALGLYPARVRRHGRAQRHQRPGGLWPLRAGELPHPRAARHDGAAPAGALIPRRRLRPGPIPARLLPHGTARPHRPAQRGRQTLVGL